MTESGKYLRGENTSEQVSNDPTNSVHCEDIEGIIGANEELELRSDVAADSTDNAENDSCPGGDETRGWCNGDEAGDGA
ncbi:hypothetical protein RRF57_008583 [Xylaria bambusicola]|uniref:Uncharacterized protein n=1 Tax=Xylaria bambusicola TaxID=326684 RepID=A0AAN7Z0U3_9PEZI